MIWVGCCLAVSLARGAVAADDPAEPGGRAAPPTDAGSPRGAFVIAGYLPHYRLDRWRPAPDLPLTDIIFFSVTLTDDGAWPNQPVKPAVLATLASIKKTTNVRLLLCIGGWGRSGGFAKMVADPAKRSAFVQSLHRYLAHYGFDGVDFDWEFPQTQADRQGLAAVLKQTRQAVQPAGRIVTIAQSGYHNLGADIWANVDRVHLMSYDHSYPQATLAKTQADVARLLRWGCPRSKLVVGVPFYGRAQDRQARSYANLQRSHTPHAGADVIAGFAANGPVTLAKKTAWAKQQRLAGMMIWELGQDTPDRLLLRAIGNAAAKPLPKPGEKP